MVVMEQQVIIGHKHPTLQPQVLEEVVAVGVEELRRASSAAVVRAAVSVVLVRLV